MKKLVLSAILATSLVTSASAWDFCSTESQIGIAAGSMGTGIAVASATAGGVPGLIVGAILNQWLCDPQTSSDVNPEEPKTEVQTELKTAPLDGVESIYFSFDSVVLDEEAKADIKDDSNIIKSIQETPIRIEGNADSRGSDEYNYALGLKRAEEVKSRLISEGVTNKLETVSYGESKPTCSELTEDCFSKNRRVEFKIAQ